MKGNIQMAKAMEGSPKESVRGNDGKSVGEFMEGCLESSEMVAKEKFEMKPVDGRFINDQHEIMDAHAYKDDRVDFALGYNSLGSAMAGESGGMSGENAPSSKPVEDSKFNYNG